jgi:pimeloyl-ACP methyl ester carboxylesterase
MDRSGQALLLLISGLQRDERATNMPDSNNTLTTRYSRRTANSMILGTLGSLLLPQHGVFAGSSASRLNPFRVNIPRAKIDHIIKRVREAKWPDRLDQDDWGYGANWDYMKSLAKYWVKQFDWRKAEANLNRYPQFLARVGDYDIHFYYVRGRAPKPMPLILTHGWPGSVFEFLEAIGPLSDPAAFGGSADDAFDVVVPSLPGYGFSSKPRGKPVGPATTAKLWNTLMTQVLGYSKYGAQGGDLGEQVTTQLGRAYPESLTGIHLNDVGEDLKFPDESERTAEERAWIRDSDAEWHVEGGYSREQHTRPQTVAFGLTDNPLGTAAWLVEKLKVWSDSPDRHEPVFTMDQVLTDVMIYLVTDSISSSIWFYRGLDDDPILARGVSVPTGVVYLPHEMLSFKPPRSVLERNFNLVRFTHLTKGGHFAFWEQPGAMIDDVRLFFRPLRA